MKNIILLVFLISPFLLLAQQRDANNKSQNAAVAAVPPPLYVLDGKVLPAKVKAGKDSSQLVSPIDSIDPKTIDKVEVLNGPSAIEKYGEAGKNGVVIITRKKNSTQKTQ